MSTCDGLLAAQLLDERAVALPAVDADQDLDPTAESLGEDRADRLGQVGRTTVAMTIADVERGLEVGRHAGMGGKRESSYRSRRWRRWFLRREYTPAGGAAARRIR